MPGCDWLKIWVVIGRGLWVPGFDRLGVICSGLLLADVLGRGWLVSPVCDWLWVMDPGSDWLLCLLSAGVGEPPRSDGEHWRAERERSRTGPESRLKEGFLHV